MKVHALIFNVRDLEQIDEAVSKVSETRVFIPAREYLKRISDTLKDKGIPHVLLFNVDVPSTSNPENDIPRFIGVYVSGRPDVARKLGVEYEGGDSLPIGVIYLPSAEVEIDPPEGYSISEVTLLFLAAIVANAMICLCRARG